MSGCGRSRLKAEPCFGTLERLLWERAAVRADQVLAGGIRRSDQLVTLSVQNSPNSLLPPVTDRMDYQSSPARC